MEIIFPTKIGSKCQERPLYPIICVLRGGKAGSQFPGLRGVFVCSAGSRHLTRPPILYPEVRLSYYRHSGQDIPVWPYVLSCPSTQKCRLLSLFGTGGCRSVVKGRLRGGT